MMWTELVQYSVVALMLDIREHVRFIDERVKNVKTDRAKSKDSHSSLLCSHSHFSLAVKYNRSCSVFLFIMRHPNVWCGQKLKIGVAGKIRLELVACSEERFLAR